MGPGRGLDRAGGSKRPRNRRRGRVGSVVIPADQRRRRTSRREGGSPKLGNMEKPPRPPAHLHDDPGVHGTRRVRRVPKENRTGDDGHLSLLREGRGTAQHTLEFYPAWELSRSTLRHVIREELAPSTITDAMLSGSQEYEAICLFCERVMLAKERAEREKRRRTHTLVG